MGSWKVFYDGVIRANYYPTTSDCWEIGFWDMQGGETCAAAAARLHGVRDGRVAQFAAQQQAAILANTLSARQEAARVAAALAASQALMARVQSSVDNLTAALLALEP